SGLSLADRRFARYRRSRLCERPRTRGSVLRAQATASRRVARKSLCTRATRTLQAGRRALLSPRSLASRNAADAGSTAPRTQHHVSQGIGGVDQRAARRLVVVGIPEVEALRAPDCASLARAARRARLPATGIG